MGGVLQPQGTSMGARTTKAGREQVLAAADAILLSGQRPTIEAIQARLGGGSPNSIVAYLKDWYTLLGERLAESQAPAEGLVPEVHQAALALQRTLQRSASSTPSADTTEALIRSLRAEVRSLQILLDELRSQKLRDQQTVAEARALLLRKDEELQGLNRTLSAALSQVAVLSQSPKRRSKRASATNPVRKKRTSSRARVKLTAKSSRKTTSRRPINRQR